MKPGLQQTKWLRVPLCTFFSAVAVFAALALVAKANPAYANDDDDTDSGPNNLQNYPENLSATASGGTGTIKGKLVSQDGNYTIEFFSNVTCDNSGFGEGQKYLGLKTVTVSGGAVNFESVSFTLNAGDHVTATATDSAGNTSEFSNCATVTGPTLPTISIDNVTHNEGDSGTTAFTFTVSNPSGDAVSFNYETQDGTAAAPSDYTSIATTSTGFAQGETSKQITVFVNGDTAFESSETFFVKLSSISGATTSNDTGTGTITNDDSPLISGHVDYCITPSDNVPGVTIGVTGSQTTSTTTDSIGNYSINLPEGGNYTLTPTKAALAPLAPGIDTADVVGAQRQFLGLTSLIGCALTAADATEDSTIDTVDAIAIQHFFLGQSSGNVGKYQFSPASRSYSSLTSAQASQDFDTLILGDVIASYADRAGGPSQDAAGSNSIEVPSTVAAVALPEVAGDAAVLVDPYDPEAIADAIYRVLTDEALRCGLRQKGLARAREFSWEASVGRVREIYGQVNG